MHRQDAIYLDQLCPKISNKNWKESLYKHIIFNNQFELIKIVNRLEKCYYNLTYQDHYA